MERAYFNTEEAAHRRVSPSIRMQTQMGGGAGMPSQMDFLIYFNQSHCWVHSPEIYF